MKQLNTIAYTLAALAFVTATAAMASFATPTLLAHLDPATADSVILAAQAGFLF
jgi:hypothetical protein